MLVLSKIMLQSIILQLKWPIFVVSVKGGNLDFLDFLHNKIYYNIHFWSSDEKKIAKCL